METAIGHVTTCDYTAPTISIQQVLDSRLVTSTVPGNGSRTAWTIDAIKSNAYYPPALGRYFGC